MLSFKTHKFMRAWKRGVELHPEFFSSNSTSKNITKIKQLKPIAFEAWSELIQYQSNGTIVFLSAMTSFYDAKYGCGSYKEYYSELEIIDMESIVSSLDGIHRSILSDLFLNY